MTSGSAAEQDGEAEGAVQALEGMGDGFIGGGAGVELHGQQMRDDFAVGLRGQRAAGGEDFLAQRLEVFDDAIVDQRDFVGGVRVGIVGGRRAMRGPAGVGDADAAGQRIGGEHGDEIVELAGGAAAIEQAIIDCRQPRRIVAAIFERRRPSTSRSADRTVADRCR